MSVIARSHAIALTGLVGTPVLVEAAISQQLPGIAIIGLPDTALTEAKLRVKVASAQAGYPLSDRCITINLSPAALPKQGSSFDLAIALSCLSASGHIADPSTKDCAYIGELSLDSTVRRSAGLLSAVVAAHRAGFKRVMVSAAAADEAALVPGIEVIAVRTLAAAVAWHAGKPGEWEVYQRDPAALKRHTEAADPATGPDLADIIGQADCVDALTIAAAGRHHISMLGSPGAGKTMLAASLPGILPRLEDKEALETSSVLSLNDKALPTLVRVPPFVAPHHTASAAAIIGATDRGDVKPGAVTLANNGVLFLDEAPEFAPSVLDALRQPLESGTIEIHRARVRNTLPAKFQLVLAANPCPCGYALTTDAVNTCSCTPQQRRRYLTRISGPLRDRIDIHLMVPRVTATVRDAGGAPQITSATVRQQVVRARARQHKRFAKTAWNYNSEAPGTWLRDPDNAPARDASAVLDRALHGGAISLRGYDRVLRLAWTIADMDESDMLRRCDIAKALMLRESEMP